MRKLVFHISVSVDGFFEGPNHEIDWHHVDSEFNLYAAEMLDNSDILLFGRKTYELMAGYWPLADTIKSNPLIASRMNSKQKIVCSNTLTTLHWENTQLLKGHNAIEKICGLKQMPGKNITVLGSPTLTTSLMAHKLIDEFHITVNPILLGGGHTLFEGQQDRFPLVLNESRNFSNGNVLNRYRPY